VYRKCPALIVGWREFAMLGGVYGFMVQPTISDTTPFTGGGAKAQGAACYYKPEVGNVNPAIGRPTKNSM
jgi:hypothetical protein